MCVNVRSQKRVSGKAMGIKKIIRSPSLKALDC